MLPTNEHIAYDAAAAPEEDREHNIAAENEVVEEKPAVVPVGQV